MTIGDNMDVYSCPQDVKNIVDSIISDLLENCASYTANAHDARKYLRRLSNYCNENRIDILKTVISVMRRYQTKRKVQSRGTACLQNFFSHNNVEDVDINVLNEIVDILVIVIESYFDNDRIINRALWILCNIRVLEHVEFDSYRCLKTIMSYFITSSDPEIDRLALLLCYSFSYEITINELLKFDFPPQYQAKLLSMIRPKANTKPIDRITLKALSALTSVTSENMSACEMLIKQGDVEMIIEMLDTFDDEFEVVAELLAILYNVLEEVKDLRQQLVQQPIFIEKISRLLDSDHISVSYEAAGVMSYLLVEMPTRPELQDQLHRVINNWQIPKTKGMSVYRSFKPLYSLLQCTNVYSVQLYAAWCIRQTCACKPDVYCKMLKRENGLEILKKLEEDDTTHPHVRNLCSEISSILSNKIDNNT